MKKSTFAKASIFLAASSALLMPNLAKAHQIIDANGAVTVETSDSNSKNTIGVGGTLLADAIVTAPEETKAMVMCDDFSLWEIPAGSPTLVSDGCGQTMGKAITGKAGENDATIPYVITPRYTTLSMGTGFPIQWNGVDGAQTYRVTLHGEDGSTWTKEVMGSSTVTYDGAALEPELYYLINVEADTGVSSDQGTGDKLGFTVIPNDKAAKLQAQLEMMEETALSPEGAAIAKAKFYQNINFAADALMTLNPLVTAGTTNPLIHQTLGDIYAATGLNEMAQTQYEQVINLTNDDVADRSLLADAHGGLAVTHLNLGNKFQAGKLMAQAQNVYTTIGQGDRGMTLENSLLSLQQDQDNAPTLMAGFTRGGGETDPFHEVVTPQNSWDDCPIPGLFCWW